MKNKNKLILIIGVVLIIFLLIYMCMDHTLHKNNDIMEISMQISICIKDYMSKYILRRFLLWQTIL